MTRQRAKAPIPRALEGLSKLRQLVGRPQQLERTRTFERILFNLCYGWTTQDIKGTPTCRPNSRTFPILHSTNMSQESPIAVSSRSPSPKIVITRADTPELRAELATRINGAHPDLHNSLWLAQAHAAMIGHFASTFNAPITEVLENFGSDPSVVSNVFNSTVAPAPTASPDPLMIPPMPSPILPNHEPITPTSPVPTYIFPPPYPTTPSDHFDVASTPSRPPTPALEHVLAAIEAEVVAEAVEDARPQPGVQLGPDWFHNFEDPGYRFFKLIPDPTGQLHIAPFIRVDLTVVSPQLLMTNGKNCLTHS